MLVHVCKCMRICGDAKGIPSVSLNMNVHINTWGRGGEEEGFFLKPFPSIMKTKRSPSPFFG